MKLKPLEPRPVHYWTFVAHRNLPSLLHLHPQEAGTNVTQRLGSL